MAAGRWSGTLPGVGHSDEIMRCRSSITDLRGRAKREELLGSAEHAVRVLAQLLELINVTFPYSQVASVYRPRKAGRGGQKIAAH